MADILYTAREINRRLDLIAENKNLLPYPYNALPVGLTDVGDGSILTADRSGAYNEESFFLNECILTAGKKYTISLDITDILEVPTIVSGFELKVEITGRDTISGITDYAVLDLSTASEDLTAVISLIVPNTFDTGLLIKPQIEEGEQKTNWVPYMDKIGTYVDRRFNSTNAKLKATKEYIDSLILSTLNTPV